MVSVGSGALMLYRALRRRSLIKGATAGYMLYRGITGHCPVTGFLESSPGLQNISGRSTHSEEEGPVMRNRDDEPLAQAELLPQV